MKNNKINIQIQTTVFNVKKTPFFYQYFNLSINYYTQLRVFLQLY
ncbi:hypothetical protein MtrunA17_Chr3g0111321 [Medicago truncatula]|uniref:Uncharacterized protein n=1 Tax=Medicago truncatula TaxID=3880 RepID=A0A396IV08_MEDTR|nr:hypothetical protein MtrunA17_Chr3g0111321 [Medicago truncatula]